jgi:hypothetical protein
VDADLEDERAAGLVGVEALRMASAAFTASAGFRKEAMTASPMVVAPLLRTVTSSRRSKWRCTSENALRSPMRSYNSVDPLRSVKKQRDVLHADPFAGLDHLGAEQIPEGLRRKQALAVEKGHEFQRDGAMSKPGGSCAMQTRPNSEVAFSMLKTTLPGAAWCIAYVGVTSPISLFFLQNARKSPQIRFFLRVVQSLGSRIRTKIPFWCGKSLAFS